MAWNQFSLFFYNDPFLSIAVILFTEVTGVITHVGPMDFVIVFPQGTREVALKDAR